MKKKLLALILAVAALTCSLCFTGCNTDGAENNGLTEYTIETVYAQAKDLGYTGTLEEFITSISGKDGKDGKDGVGVLKVEVDNSGYLIVTLTDNTTVNCGKVVVNDDIINNFCRHKYSDWTVGVTPTCTSIGYNVRVCELCGDKDYEFFAAVEHGYICTQYSKQSHTLYCPDCGKTVTEEHKIENGACKICGMETQSLDFQLSETNTYYAVTGGDTIKPITNLFIPDTYENLPVAGINDYVFANYNPLFNRYGFYNFNSVTLPVSITSIGKRPFPNECTINYLGTRAQWEAIEKAEGWDDGMSYTVICIDD